MKGPSFKYIIAGLFVFVSVLCMIVFLLPSGIQESLKARSDNWSLLTFFMSAFVHMNLEHLLSNIISFLLFGFLVYTINCKSRQEKAFLVSLLLTVFLLPLIYNVSFAFIANFIFRWSYVSCGLSIVVAGLIGLTIPSLCVFLEEPLRDSKNNLYFFISTTFLTGSAIALPYVTLNVYNMTVFVLTLIIGLILLIRVGIKTLDFVKQSANMKRRMLIALLILFIYFIFLSLLFPSNIVTPDGGVVNIFAHQVGVFFGVILGLCALNGFQKKPIRLMEKTILQNLLRRRLYAYKIA